MDNRGVAMKNINDKILHEISTDVYSDSINPIVFNGIEGTVRYEPIVDKSLSLNDDDTGFDARVYQNRDNPNEIIIGYRGTEGDDLRGEGWPDLKADVKHFVTDRNPIDLNSVNQFTQGVDLYLEVKEKYPDAKITLTGHSLGAAIATYVAALHELDALGFSTPSALHLLPEDLQNKAKDGHFDDKIVNYINPEDMIGAGFMNEWERQIGSAYYIGEPYVVAHNGKKLFDRITGTMPAHELKRFIFNEHGDLNNPEIFDVINGIRITGSPRSVDLGSATIELTPEELMAAAERIKNLITKITDIADDSHRAMTRLNNIKIYANTHNDALRATNKFRNWFEERALEAVYDIEEAAKLFEKADQLK